MKKSVALVIMAIFIASIFLIGFFGIQIKSYNQIIYCNSIVLTNEEYKDTTGVIILKKDRDYESLPFKYQLTYQVLPTNATNQKIEYTCTQDPSISIDEYGKLTINSLITFKVFLRTVDGSNIIKEVRIKVL